MRNSFEYSSDRQYLRIFFRNGSFFLIDAEDFPAVSQRTWSLGKRGYPVSHTSRKMPGGARTEPLHRYLMKPEPGYEVDHISGNKLDNRRKNLRICSHQQNMFNQRIRCTNSSGYQGVSYHKKAEKYEAYISRDGKKIYLGLFISAEAAAAARDCAASKLYGEYANLNIRRESS